MKVSIKTGLATLAGAAVLATSGFLVTTGSVARAQVDKAPTVESERARRLEMVRRQFEPMAEELRETAVDLEQTLADLERLNHDILFAEGTEDERTALEEAWPKIEGLVQLRQRFGQVAPAVEQGFIAAEADLTAALRNWAPPPPDEDGGDP